MKRIKGEITVLFTLLLVVILSFINSMLFIVSIQTSKNLSKTNMNMAVNSVFAEYEQQLLETYDIFALDETYETGNVSVSNIIDRLSYYGAAGMDQKIKKKRYLTDDHGAAFYEQAIKAVSGGLLPASGSENSNISDGDDSILSKALQQWGEQQESAEAYSQEESSAKQQLERLLAENELDLGEDNPFRKLQEWKDKEILGLILPENAALSNQSVTLSQLVSHRSLQSGTGGYSCEYSNGMAEKLLFLKYLKGHFSCFISDEKEGALQYEMEYLLIGKASDTENLKAVVEKLLIVRLGSNFLYLNSDEEKKAQARTAALAISGVTGIPALEEPVTQGILVVWAFEESVNDIKSLVRGGKISLMKSKEEWNHPGDGTKGLTYDQYLEILLFLSKPNNVRMRALDLIEQNMRYVYGKENFRADVCINQLQIQTVSHLEHGMTYKFDTEFGYQ